MKKISFLLCLMACIKSFAQDAGIDTIVTANEGKVATIFQKMEKSSIESTGHGKNPKFVSSIYSFTDDKLLNSATDIVFFSIGDTSFIINYYFDSGQLIKVKTIIFDNNKHPDKDILYFNNNKVISEESELAGLKNPRYYLNRAKELIKKHYCPTKIGFKNGVTLCSQRLQVKKTLFQNRG